MNGYPKMVHNKAMHRSGVRVRFFNGFDWCFWFLEDHSQLRPPCDLGRSILIGRSRSLFWRFVFFVAAVFGVLAVGNVGSRVALALLHWKRSLRPQGPMMMGDLESPIVAIGGYLVGIAAGSMLAVYWLRRSWPTGVSLGTEPKSTTDDLTWDAGSYYRFIGFAVTAIICFSGLSAYFVAWESTRNWEFPLKLSWTIWLTVNVVAPLIAVVGLSWGVRSRRAEM
jgi:hypothetical protein